MEDGLPGLAGLKHVRGQLPAHKGASASSDPTDPQEIYRKVAMYLGPVPPLAAARGLGECGPPGDYRLLVTTLAFEGLATPSLHEYQPLAVTATRRLITDLLEERQSRGRIADEPCPGRVATTKLTEERP